MSNSKSEFNRNAAKELAEQMGFDPDRMVVCVSCGRTAIRSPKANSSLPDSLYCTCESVGPPMVEVVRDD